MRAKIKITLECVQESNHEMTQTAGVHYTLKKLVNAVYIDGIRNRAKLRAGDELTEQEVEQIARSTVHEVTIIS